MDSQDQNMQNNTENVTVTEENIETISEIKPMLSRIERRRLREQAEAFAAIAQGAIEEIKEDDESKEIEEVGNTVNDFPTASSITSSSDNCKAAIVRKSPFRAIGAITGSIGIVSGLLLGLTISPLTIEEDEVWPTALEFFHPEIINNVEPVTIARLEFEEDVITLHEDEVLFQGLSTVSSAESFILTASPCDEFISNNISCTYEFVANEDYEAGHLLTVENDEYERTTHLTYSAGVEYIELPEYENYSLFQLLEYFDSLPTPVIVIEFESGVELPLDTILSISLTDEFGESRVLVAGDAISNGILNQDNQIVVTVSDGTRVIPSFENLTREQAIAKAEELDIHVEFVLKDSDLHTNLAIDQWPAEGSYFSTDSVMQVFFSNLDETNTVTMPNVLRSNYMDAQLQLLQMGFERVITTHIPGTQCVIDSPHIIQVIPNVGQEAFTNEMVVLIASDASC